MLEQPNSFSLNTESFYSLSVICPISEVSVGLFVVCFFSSSFVDMVPYFRLYLVIFLCQSLHLKNYLEESSEAQNKVIFLPRGNLFALARILGHCSSVTI